MLSANSLSNHQELCIGGEAEASLLGNVATLKVALAATLLVTHGLSVLHGVSGSTTHLLPAVPIFLWVSGYFMLANYKRSMKPLAFLSGRYLKLFPIMFVSFIAMFCLVVLFSGGDISREIQKDVPLFLLTHFSIFQNFVPASFEALDGTVHNGSLWFIEAILIIYATLPIIVWGEKRVKHVLLVLCCLSAVFSVFFPVISQGLGGTKQVFETAINIDSENIHPLIKHVLDLCVQTAGVAWMFYAGCIVRRYQRYFFGHFNTNMVIFLSFAITVLLYLLDLGNWNHYGITPPWFFTGYLIVWLLIHFAVLRKIHAPPISIGLYVLHMPVFYALEFLNFGHLLIAAPVVLLLSFLSLTLIEKPMAAILRKRLLPS
ncbi:acyltransferase [Amylibacter sp.]|nr:acyltransferase [Amylibacter sp.]